MPIIHKMGCSLVVKKVLNLKPIHGHYKIIDALVNMIGTNALSSEINGSIERWILNLVIFVLVWRVQLTRDNRSANSRRGKERILLDESNNLNRSFLRAWRRSEWSSSTVQHGWEGFLSFCIFVWRAAGPIPDTRILVRNPYWTTQVSAIGPK